MMDIEARLRISVIVPYYNTPVRYLSPFLESVLKQDYGDFELIIVNDGSTDEESLALLKGITDPRLTVLDASHGGVSAARNLGLDHISGDLLYFADSDDELVQGLFSHVAGNFGEDPELDLLVFSTDNRSVEGKVRPNQHLQPMTFTGEECLAAICTSDSFMYNNLWGKVYNISRIGKENVARFDTSIRRAEDRFWNLMMAQHVAKGRTSSFVGYIHNANPGSITHQGNSKIAALDAYDKMLGYIEGKEGRSANYHEMMASYYNKIQWYLILCMFSKGNEDKKLFRQTLIRLHKDLKGNNVKSREYAWRKWLHYPLLLIAR